MYTCYMHDLENSLRHKLWSLQYNPMSQISALHAHDFSSFHQILKLGNNLLLDKALLQSHLDKEASRCRSIIDVDAFSFVSLAWP